MTDRNATLQWLVHQAKHRHGNGVFVLDTPDVTRAKVAAGLRTGEVALSEDLAWDLASGAVTLWFEPEFPELEMLNYLEKLNLLRLAVELATDAGIRSAIWLALATHNYSSAAVNAGLGQHYLPELLARLNSHFSPGIPLENIHDTLACLDSIIDSVDEQHDTICRVIATAAVTSFAHYGSTAPGTAGGAGSTVSAEAAIADWVLARANDVLEIDAAPDVYRLEMYRCVCSSASALASQRMQEGQLPVSDLLTWYEDYMSRIDIPRILDSRLEVSLRTAAQRSAYFVGEIGAEWLVNSGHPSSALELIASLGERYPDAVESGHFQGSTAVLRASAYAALGNIGRATEELDDVPLDLDGSGMWATGRLWCEIGDDQGLSWLRKADDLPREFGYGLQRARKSLLLSEQEVEKGNPRKALETLSYLRNAEIGWIKNQASVIVAEAYLAIARGNNNSREQYLNYASQILYELAPDDIFDTPDRIKPRALAAKGEIAILRGDYRTARDLLRKVMEELDRDPPMVWINPETMELTRLTPFDSPDKFWLRPWDRNWAQTAELCLLAELQGRPRAESAFVQLQRYRMIIHSSTIAELAGFTSETALAVEQREILGRYRVQSAQLTARESHLRQELQRIDASTTDISVLPSHSLKRPRELHALRQLKPQLQRELEDNLATKEQVDGEIEQISIEIEETRGYLSKPNGLRSPELSEIKRHLAQEDAAVVELVRVDGTRWGLPVRWHAFAVTDDVGVTHVELPAKEIDHELAQLRSDRTKWQKHTIGKISDLIFANLPKQVFACSNLYIAADGDAWAIPFRSLVRRRWRFVPWKLTDESTYSNWPVPAWLRRFLDSLATRMDKGAVSNVISTSHLVRLFQRSHQRDEPEDAASVVGSSGGSQERILCEGLAASLELHPPGGVEDTQWRKYPGSIEASTPPGGDRPEWLEGTSRVFMGSWHTSFSVDPSTVAIFHFDDRQMPLAEFLSRSRHKTNIAVILSCNISLPSNEYNRPVEQDRVFSRMGSAGFGLVESLQAEAMVATTNEVTAEVAFVLGRFLAAELADGADVHTALATSQQRLRECSVGDVIHLLEELEQDVPETSDWLRVLRSRKPGKKGFPQSL